MTASPFLAPDERADLLRAALEQLEREEALLDASVTALQRLRQAILKHNHAELADALRQQPADAPLRETVQHQRDAFRRAAARTFGTAPDSISMGFLLKQWPRGEVVDLAERRERLLQNALKAERLERETTALIHHHLGFIRRLLADFLGNANSLAYGPLARSQDATCGRLFEGQG